MVQAARSGVQNIAEGSRVSGTSKKMELKLTNVARASLEELALDYEDYLRHRGLRMWPRSDPRRQGLVDRRPATADDFAFWVQEIHGQSSSTGSTGSTPQATYPEIAANGALALIAVADTLLKNQIKAQATAFESDGGFTERLYRTRKRRRDGG